MSWPLGLQVYFKHDRSDVIVLRFMSGKSSGLQMETVGDLTCRLGMVGCNVFQRSTRDKFRSSRSDGLGDSVGKEDDDLSGLQQYLVLTGEFAVGKKSQGWSVALQDMD